MKSNPERSLPEITKDLAHDLTTLLKSEIALAKTELQANVTRIGTGAGLFGGAGVVGLFAVEFFLLALMFGLIAAGLRSWLAALVVGIVLGIVAAVLAMRGKKSVAGASLAPARAIEHLKADLETIKSEVDHVRSR